MSKQTVKFKEVHNIQSFYQKKLSKYARRQNAWRLKRKCSYTIKNILLATGANACKSKQL